MKIIRVFIGTILGLWLADYFLHGFAITDWLTYLYVALIVMAVGFVVRGFSF